MWGSHHSCAPFAHSVQLHGRNWFFVSLFPCPFATEGEQKGLSGRSSKCFVRMSSAVTELLHLWTFRCVCSSSVGSKCSRSAGYPFSGRQPVRPDCKTPKKTRKRKVGQKVGEGSFQGGSVEKAGAKACSRVRI